MLDVCTPETPYCKFKQKLFFILCLASKVLAFFSVPLFCHEIRDFLSPKEIQEDPLHFRMQSLVFLSHMEKVRVGPRKSVGREGRLPLHKCYASNSLSILNSKVCREKQVCTDRRKNFTE